MFYSYTGKNNKNILERFHPPNKCSKFLLISLSKFCCRKVTWGYAKVIHKKREKIIEKMDKCLRYLKQWVLRCPPEKKREMNKIAHVLLQKYFQASKEIYVFMEHIRIRLDTIYIHTHAHLDLIVWLNSLWIRCLTLQYMHLQVCSSFLSTYELHIKP